MTKENQTNLDFSFNIGKEKPHGHQVYDLRNMHSLRPTMPSGTLHSSEMVEGRTLQTGDN